MPFCSVNPCYGSARCVPDPLFSERGECVCQEENFFGLYCEQSLCLAAECNNNGECPFASYGVPQCFCFPGFTGSTCNILTGAVPVPLKKLV